MSNGTRRRLLGWMAGSAAAAGLPLAACSTEPLSRLPGSAFGTPGELLLWGPAEDAAARQAQRVWDALAAFDADWLAAPARVAGRLAASAPPAAAAGSHGDSDIAWRGLGLETAAAQLELPDPGGALLTVGQHLLALGERGYRPWHVGIPDPAGQRPLLGLDLYAGERLVTVADYARYRKPGQTSADLAPDPGAGACASCSVVMRGAPAVSVARAASLLHASPAPAWPDLARALGAEAVLWIGRDGALEATAVFAGRALLGDQRRHLKVRAGS
ncbi:MAG: FAD:protein FMN transferase [Pseudomonadota bacterium]|nr:FAD:protein FMN transferase [Pseudomonadota bacterium]